MSTQIFLLWLALDLSNLISIMLTLACPLAIVVICLFFFLVHKSIQERIQAMKTFAAQNGWTYSPYNSLPNFENAEDYSLSTTIPKGFPH